MKKSVILPAILLLGLFAQAKDYHLVVKPKGQGQTVNTEVTSHEGEDSDTLTVTPGTGITAITVTVRDLGGALISNDVLSAAGDYLELSTPPAPGGCLITLRDDNGVVYMEYEE